MNYKKIQTFWNKQAENYDKIPLTGLACLGEDKELLEYRDETEKRHFLKLMRLNPAMSILDVGCGIGRWSFIFAEKCKKVVALDFAENLIRIAKLEAKKRNLKNIEFRKVGATIFKSKEKFDIIFFSGLLQYINDEDMPNLIKNYSNLLKRNGLIVNRSPSANYNTYQFSNETYTTIYRNEKDYNSFFEKEGFGLVYSNFVYPPFNLPLFLYYRFIPKILKQIKFIKTLLRAALATHINLDPLFLKFKKIYPFLLDLRRKKKVTKIFVYKKYEKEIK